jgi:flagellar hook assembly protein FlgD
MLRGLTVLAVGLGLTFHSPPARSDAASTRKPKTTVWKRPADCDSAKIPLPPGRVVLRIEDAAGRLVGRIVTSPLEPGTSDRFWNGLNDKGAVVKGVYTAKVTSPSGTGSRAVVLR